MDAVRLVFRTRCANGHQTQQELTRTPEEAAAPASMRFSCQICDAVWQPTTEERVRIRALKKYASKHGNGQVNARFVG